MKRGLRKVSLRKISEKILWLMTLIFSVAGQEEAKGPGNVIARPGEDVELLCTVTPSSGNAYFAWMVNYMGPYGVNSLHNGVLPGYSATLDKSNIIVKNIVMNDGRNGSKFKCVTVLNGKVQDESDTTYLYVAGVPKMVPDLNTNIDINGSNVTLTLSWGEPFNNLDPIVNYTVSCSGDITCPPNFTTTDNTTRSYTITNLTTMTNYAFSVVATNSIGSGEAGIVMITTPPGNTSVSITTSSKSVTVTTQGVNVTTYSSSEDMLITTSSVSMTANTLSVGMTTTTSSQGMATTTSSVGITTTTSSEGMTTTSSEGMTTTSSVGMTSVDITTTSREGVTTTTSNEGMTTTTSSESMTTTTSNEGMTTTTSSEGMTTTTSNKGMTTTSSVDVTTTSSVGMTTTTSVGSVTSPMATSATVAPTVTPTVITSMAPSVVPNVTVDSNTININGNDVTLTLSWGEPFNNFDPIVYYTVSCSGDVTCPQNFTTTDNTTRSYTITNLTTMTNYTFSVVATNSIGSGEAGVVMITTPVIYQVSGISITCTPLLLITECTAVWNDVQSEVLSYQVNYNGTTMNVNSSTTTLTFIAPSLPDDEFSGTVVVMVTAVNRFGSGPASDPATTEINNPSIMDATSVLNAPNAINELHSITVTCTIHPDSTADQCVVTAMADGRVTRTGIAPITNGIATVTVNGLECGVTYTIIAGGTLNGDLVGPRSSHGNINMGPCPLANSCDNAVASNDNGALLGAVVGVLCTVIIIIVITNIMLWIYCFRKRHHVGTLHKGEQHSSAKQMENPAYEIITDHRSKSPAESINCYAEIIIPQKAKTTPKVVKTTPQVKVTPNPSYAIP